MPHISRRHALALGTALLAPAVQAQAPKRQSLALAPAFDPQGRLWLAGLDSAGRLRLSQGTALEQGQLLDARQPLLHSTLLPMVFVLQERKREVLEREDHA